MPPRGGLFKSPYDTFVGRRIRSCGDLHAPVVVVDEGVVQFAIDGFADFGVGVGLWGPNIASCLVRLRFGIR